MSVIKQRRCCSDCGAFCKSLCIKLPEDDELVGDSQTHIYILFERAFNKVAKSIKRSLSWTTATLLITASFAQIEKHGIDDIIVQRWIYASVMLVLSVVIVLPFYFGQKPEILVQQLELTVPEKKIALGDEKEINKDKIKKNNAIHTILNKTPKENAKRFLKFIELELNYFSKDLEKLFTIMFSIASSRALNDAVMGLYNENIRLRIELSHLWLYTFVVAWITIGINVRGGSYLDKISIQLNDNIEQNGIQKESHSILSYGTIKRVITVISSTWSMVWAWSLRDAMRASILAIYGGSATDESIISLWTYTIVSTCVVSIGNTIAASFYILYPKGSNSHLILGTDERTFIDNAFYINFQTLIGLSWADAIIESFHIKFGEISNQTLAIWISFTVFEIISIAGGYIWSEIWDKFETLQKGSLNAFYNDNNHLFDVQHVRDEDEKNSKINDKIYGFWVVLLNEFVNLILNSFAIGAGSILSNAITISFEKIHTGIFESNIEASNDKAFRRSLWISWVVATISAVIILSFTNKIQDGIKKKRIKLINECAGYNDDDKELKEIQTKISSDSDGNGNNDGTTDTKEQPNKDDDTDLTNDENKKPNEKIR